VFFSRETGWGSTGGPHPARRGRNDARERKSRSFKHEGGDDPGAREREGEETSKRAQAKQHNPLQRENSRMTSVRVTLGRRKWRRVDKEDRTVRTSSLKNSPMGKNKVPARGGWAASGA